ncbi:hypothetical protein Forpi1262_v016847 [Fusarium oxysporum f. sp. raphani]|uniref:Uncharacterized protein n=1 Tax=Fusarium oxysporum f. sp. raphani TaxID=96318 RepID=A0A8J5NYS2_FUSOX|nr:hypothetical protein Forpi1262_v016847 [Fusarium oxysporum f. sp. raphani]
MPIAENIGESLHEHRSDVQHPTVSFSVIQGTFPISNPLKPVQPMAVNDLENNRTQGQTQVPVAENTVGYLQGNHSDGGHLTASSSFFPKRNAQTSYENRPPYGGRQHSSDLNLNSFHV